jgi:hypothetical protein
MSRIEEPTDRQYVDGPSRFGRKNGMQARKKKIAVSIAAPLLRRVQAAVTRKRAKSVSAYVERAVAAQLAAETSFDELLADALAQTGGPPTRTERALARRLLRGAAA